MLKKTLTRNVYNAWFSRFYRKACIASLILVGEYKKAQEIYYSVFHTDEISEYDFNPDVIVVNDINAMPIAEKYLKFTSALRQLNESKQKIKIFIIFIF